MYRLKFSQGGLVFEALTGKSTDEILCLKFFQSLHLSVPVSLQRVLILVMVCRLLYLFQYKTLFSILQKNEQKSNTTFY